MGSLNILDYEKSKELAEKEIKQLVEFLPVLKENKLFSPAEVHKIAHYFFNAGSMITAFNKESHIAEVESIKNEAEIISQTYQSVASSAFKILEDKLEKE